MPFMLQVFHPMARKYPLLHDMPIAPFNPVFTGTGHRPVDIPEEKKLLSARTVFFTAKACPSSTRSASLGPGTRGLDDGDDDLDDDSRPSIARSSRYAPFRSSFDPPSPHLDVNGVTTLRSPRHNSVDQYGWQRNPVDQDTAATLSDYPPTPPASPLPRTPVFDESAISRPQTPTHSRPGSSTRQHYPRRSPRAEEDPGQMLAEFRNALKVEMGTVRRFIYFRFDSRLSGNRF